VTLDSFSSTSAVYNLPVLEPRDPTNFCVFNSMRPLRVRRGKPVKIRVRPPARAQMIWSSEGAISAVVGDEPDRDGRLVISITGLELGQARLIALSNGRPIGQVSIFVVDEDTTSS